MNIINKNKIIFYYILFIKNFIRYIYEGIIKIKTNISSHYIFMK